MSEIELPGGSCTFTANVIGTQLLLSIPDSSQQPGDAAIVLENGVQYIPVYVQDALPDSNIVGSYVINDTQLPVLNQTRQIILTENQIVTLDQVSASDLQHNDFSSQILTLHAEDSQETPDRLQIPPGSLTEDKTTTVLVQKDDVTLAQGTISLNPAYPPVADDVVDPPDKTCPEVCDVCGLRFESRKLFKKHILSHLHDKPYKCPHCPESFNHEYNYIPHVATHNEKDPYCPVCDKRFSRLAGLKAHILIHQCDDTLPCPECLEEFSTHKLLEAHRLEHKTGFVKQHPRMHKCSDCEERFSTKALLKEHVLDVHKRKLPKKVKRGKGGYVCEFDDCRKRFEKPSQLVRHKRTHTGEKPFKCAECGKGFGQKGSLQIHMLKHSGLRPYACKYCSSQFSQKGNLQAHIQRIHPDERDEIRKLQCKQCSCMFRNIVSLRAHMSRNHGIFFTSKKGKPLAYEIRRQGDTILAEAVSPDTDSSNKENESKGESAGKTCRDATLQKTEGDPERKNKLTDVINKCKYCSKVFKKRADLVKHLKAHSGDTIKSELMCGVCDRNFVNESAYQTHLEAAHPEMLEFSCDLCPNKFAILEDLKIHRRSAHEEQYTCKRCNAVFESADLKQLHEAEHMVPEVSSENAVPARESRVVVNDGHVECTAIITPDGTIKLVRDEMIAEEVPVPMVADACVETDPVVLAQEVIEEPTRDVEDEARRFKCDHCSQSFKKISHYKAHLRIHTGEKPFACDKCQKLFATKSALNIHMGSHEEVPSFNCEDCGKAFSSHRSLKRHMELHAPGFPYSCTLCSRAYKTKVAWQKHLSTHLKIPEHQEPSNKVDDTTEPSRTGSDEAQFIEIIENRLDVPVEDKKGSSTSIQGDWNDLIQSLQPGQQFNLVGTTFTATAASTSVKKTTVPVPSRTSSSPVGVKFEGFAEKNSLFTPLNDQGFDGYVFLQNTTLPKGIQNVTVTTPAEVPAQLPTNTHRCSLCNLSFENLVELSIHKTTHLQGKWTTCPACYKIFGSSQEYQAHTKECPPVPSNPPLAPSGELICVDVVFERQTCAICQIRFSRTSDYVTHMNKEHGGHTCKSCPLWFQNLEELTIHNQEVHRQGSKSESSPSQMHVKIERTAASKQLTLENREKKQDGLRGKLELKRKRSAWRRQAVRTLTEEEQMAVTKASPSSISEKILQQSILRHQKSPKREVEGEREQQHPNKCKYCEKSFRKPSDLVRHLRVHTGERPYTCSSCNKSFSIKSTAKSHIQIHKKEQAYKCHICNNSFAAIGSLKVHMRLHTGAKPFACDMCDARFRTSGHRKSHMHSHKRKEVAKEKEALFLANSGAPPSPPSKVDEPPKPLPPSPSLDKPSMPDVLEIKKHSSQFLFSLEGPLSFTEQACESNQQFFLKEIKGDDTTAAAHFVVTMGDDINYAENISDLLESVPTLSEDQDKFDLDLDLPKEQLSVRACESCAVCSKVFSSCLELESHMKKDHFVCSPLSCNVCKQTFSTKADLELHNLVHELDHLSCHGCSLGFPTESALRKHKCSGDDSALKAKPTAPLDLDSVVNEFFSFPAL